MDDRPSDRDHLAATYRDHHGAVVAAARRMCGVEHAADVAQDVFLLFGRYPDRFDPDRGSLRSFLLTITHHRAVDLLRREHARQVREERVVTSEPSVRLEVDDDVLRGEVVARVLAALEALPAAERDAITTAFYGRCSYREAAVRLGQSEGTTKSRIRSGLRRLRPLLASSGAEA